MSAVETMLASPFFEALGWALIHFIWQGALVAALYGSARIVLRRASSNARYVTACAALLMMPALPVATLIVIYPSPADSPGVLSLSTPGVEARARTRPAEGGLVDLSGALWQHPAYSSSRETAAPPLPASLKRWAEDSFGSALPWFVALWFAGVFFLSIRFLGGLVLVRRLKRAQTVPAVKVWQEQVSLLCGQLRVSRPVRLCQSALVEVPTVIGWLRPVILVPASVLTGLSAPQLEALLAHELAHIRRYDYLVNLIQTAVETLLFYHPAVWWVSSHARQEREHCCDDLAVAVCNDVLVYARALAALEQIRVHTPRPAVAANGGSLLKRIQRLVGGPAQLSHRLDSWVAGLIAIATAFSILAGSQTAMLSTGATADPASSEVPASTHTAQSVSPVKPGAAAKGESEIEAQGERAALDPPPAQDEPADLSIEAADQDRDSGSQDFIGEIVAEGYTNLTVEQIVALKSHDVTPGFIRGMKSSFGRLMPVDELVALKIHGATPDLVRELKEGGLDKLSAEHVVAFRVHGVSPEFVRELKNLGYDDLNEDTLVAFRVHGVTPAFVQEVKSLGFDNPSGDEMVALRIHGATPEFIRAMKSYIGDGLKIRHLTSMRIHGVTPEFVRELEALGYKELSANDLTAFKIHGVSIQFIKSMQSLGFDKMSAVDLTALRVHNITPEFVQKVKGRGFTDVTIEELIKLKRLNIIPSSGRN
jgi:beta-lactamase regulating signal transducer with metallopeptidase domain